jgi:hypothetical protein
LLLLLPPTPQPHPDSVILSEAEGPAFALRSEYPTVNKEVSTLNSLNRNAIAKKIKTYTLAALLFLTPMLSAQRESPALSDAEVEQLRDSAYVANDRLLAFVKILDDRSKSIQTATTGPRRPGREQDLHDFMEQFTSIADELDDNLDEYGPAHRDMRTALPKLLAATERWATILKSPPDNDAYNVSRKLSLEAIRDLREESTKLIEDQRTWFAAHPPSKETKDEDHPIPR